MSEHGDDRDALYECAAYTSLTRRVLRKKRGRFQLHYDVNPISLEKGIIEKWPAAPRPKRNHSNRAFIHQFALKLHATTATLPAIDGSQRAGFWWNPRNANRSAALQKRRNHGN